MAQDYTWGRFFHDFFDGRSDAASDDPEYQRESARIETEVKEALESCPDRVERVFIRFCHWAETVRLRLRYSPLHKLYQERRHP